MNNTTYQELDDGEFSNFRRMLIDEKGSQNQKEFLEQLKKNDDFSAYLNRHGVVLIAGEDTSILSTKLSEAEFKEPTYKTEKKIFDLLKEIPRYTASRSAFWGHVTLRHIQEDKINATYLVTRSEGKNGGLKRIDGLLDNVAKDKDKNDKEIDDAIRDALRRMSGLPEVRGNRSVYSDCVFAKAWWRQSFANEVCDETGADLEKVIKVLRTKPKSFWEELVTLVVSKNSVLGDEKIRIALIWAFSDTDESSVVSGLLTKASLSHIQSQIGIRSAIQELGVYEVAELKKMIEDEFFPQVIESLSQETPPEEE